MSKGVTACAETLLQILHYWRFIPAGAELSMVWDVYVWQMRNSFKLINYLPDGNLAILPTTLNWNIYVKRAYDWMSRNKSRLQETRSRLAMMYL